MTHPAPGGETTVQFTRNDAAMAMTSPTSCAQEMVTQGAGRIEWSCLSIMLDVETAPRDQFKGRNEGKDERV
ncbi:hypothetical protein [Komagataeibacter diospyri]|uniref:hypothetical protein n=1 Tax=Komagataeibacter diospyri TaxID=1932662 RepID=UPI001D04B6BB|nr:hypothetical protein [Komagataeibacter diospyri]